MADALRLFVVTWDPLGWLAPRPEAVATANAWPLELVVYVPVWSLAGIARRKHTTMAAVLAGLGGSAITTAAAHEDAVTSGRYAELVAHGKVPDLLSGEPGPATPKRRSLSTRPPCRWPSRPRTTGQPVSCPERSSGSPVLAALSRRCSAASRAPGRADRSGKASTDRRTAGFTVHRSRSAAGYSSCSCVITRKRCRG